jgi:hypothetical protein
MKLIQRLLKFLSQSPYKLNSRDVNKRSIRELDKVGNLNKISPDILDSRLMEFGYELNKVDNSLNEDFLWSTRHFYENKKLQQIVEVRQEPHYVDYGFSVFLWKSDLQDRKLLCHVPLKLQDNENNFLTAIVDKLFTDTDISSLLKGEEWKDVSVLRIN